MNAHALAVLELSRVLELVASRALSDPGAALIRQLSPSSDRGWISAELERVRAARSLVAEHDWSPEPVPSSGDTLRRLRVAGSTLSSTELVSMAQLLRSSRLTKGAMSAARAAARDESLAALAHLEAALLSEQAPERAIERALESDGTVKDDASPALRGIRQELRGAQSELVQLLERALAGLASHQRAPDMSVTVRNGRYVIAVRREARAAVGGIVHDESASGNTLFVEPPAAVRFGNHIRELESEETREIQRILGALTDELRPLAGGLAASHDSLAELDSLYARARFAIEYDCGEATLAAAVDGMEIRYGRHPLLLAAEPASVVPFDLRMEPTERTLLLSGPNTGGKTVLLKAIGLISAMTQSGVPAPVGAGSSVPVYDDIFADIGDEQSIQASLSTFSAHLRNLSEILDSATDRSLALVDELGSGTDPVEGAALGGAILEQLTSRGTRTVATTHLGDLKLIAGSNSAIVNASLQFDEIRLAPTYRLVKGIPGRSYGLSIARRLELPRAVLDEAELRLPRAERDMSVLLAELERREAELADREQESREALENARAREARVAEREKAMRAAERGMERRARDTTREYLMEARAAVEQVIRELRQASAGEMERIARDARRSVEQRAAEAARIGESLAAEERNELETTAPDSAGDEPSVGDLVTVGSFGGREARVVELRGDDATVALGGMKLTVARGDLTVRRSREELRAAAVPIASVPESAAPSDLDLRGMRVDEIEPVLLQALDAAIREDRRELRIIHGKGTGALRERVSELLKTDPRISTFRLGAFNEGGTGVTIAEFS